MAEAKRDILDDATTRQLLIKRLRSWFRKQKRDLPWRHTNDPYAIWVSEIMLQQTQVATVIDYYHRFLKRFPTVSDLAAAETSEVLQYWEGLGYYRRARQLHQAAKKIVNEYSGSFPQEFAQVLDLPGVGRYTAGAICSFAYDQPYPIVEANTQRLYCRLLALEDDPRTSVSQKRLWDLAERIVPKKSPGEINQALMELGSLVCTPTNPKCLECPLVELCPTAKLGLQSRVPSPPKAKAFESVYEVAWVVWNGSQVLLRQCQPGERWEGLWDFPRFVCDLDTNDKDKFYKQELQKRFGLKTHGCDERVKIKHGVTRFKITLECFDTSLKNGPNLSLGAFQWLDYQELGKLPLHSTARRIAQHIVRHPRQRKLFEDD